jgi:hypothetical protein
MEQTKHACYTSITLLWHTWGIVAIRGRFVEHLWTWAEQQSVTQFLTKLNMNSITLKAAAKVELEFDKAALGQQSLIRLSYCQTVLASFRNFLVAFVPFSVANSILALSNLLVIFPLL